MIRPRELARRGKVVHAGETEGAQKRFPPTGGSKGYEVFSLANPARPAQPAGRGLCRALGSPVPAMPGTVAGTGLPARNRTGRVAPMAINQDELEQLPPQGHVKVVYLGPVAPHWDVHGVFGDGRVVDEFRQRAIARLQLLPPHDPQFRRNRERVNRDAERERLIIEWDLGYPEDEAAT